MTLHQSRVERSGVGVESTRQLPGRDTTTERRYFITSTDHRERGKDAAFFAAKIRDHWGIENKLHWSLDVAFMKMPAASPGATPPSGLGPHLPAQSPRPPNLDAIALA